VRDRSGSASARHVSAIPEVAALLRSHGRLLRSYIFANEVESTYDPKQTKAELFEEQEDMQAEHEAAMAALQAKLTASNKDKSKWQAAATSAKAHNKGATKRARDDLKAEMPKIREAAREQAEAAVEGNLQRLRVRKAEANSEKREWRARAEAAEQESCAHTPTQMRGEGRARSARRRQGAGSRTWETRPSTSAMAPRGTERWRSRGRAGAPEPASPRLPRKFDHQRPRLGCFFLPQAGCSSRVLLSPSGRVLVSGASICGW
jgi:hypothetical protein